MALEDEGKLFVGGLSWDTNEDTMRCYFSNFGKVTDVTVKRDRHSQKPRGFGFVTFENPCCASKVLAHADKHTLDGKQVDPKLAQAKTVPVSDNKVFLGGIPPLGMEFHDKAAFDAAICELKTDVQCALEKMAASNGVVENVEIKVDSTHFKHKGFAFATLSTHQLTHDICSLGYVEVRSKNVEIKKAEPRHSGKQVATGAYPQYHHASYYDSTQTQQTPASYNGYYGSSYNYTQGTSTSFNNHTHTGSQMNYDFSNYSGTQGEAAAGGYGQSYGQSYNYGSSAAGGQALHGYPQASYGAQQAQQQNTNYYNQGIHHHST